MPSSHRRIGLVVDEPIEDALGIFRSTVEPPPPEATLARRAVLEGAVLKAIQGAATAGGESGQQAGRVIEGIRQLLPTLQLSPAVVVDLLRDLDQIVERQSSEERKQRQLALLGSPNPYGEAALDYAEELDELDRLPS